MIRTNQPPALYRLRVAGLLDQRWSPWFDGFTLTHEADGSTSLTGAVTDQAQLHGLLAKIRDLGITLISVTALPGNTPPASGIDAIGEAP